MPPRPFVYGVPPRPLRVLIADDNADATNSLAELLRLVGCEVEVAYEGLSVVPMAEVFRPHVCLLDLWMPGLDGWEVARRLRATFEGHLFHLVALTGLTGRGVADASAAAGFDFHLVKPAEPDDVFAQLAEFIVRTLPVATVVG